MRISKLDDVERAVLLGVDPERERIEAAKRKLNMLIEQSRYPTTDQYSKGFVDGVKGDSHCSRLPCLTRTPC